LARLFYATEYAPGRKYQVIRGGRLFDPALRESNGGQFRGGAKLHLTTSETDFGHTTD